MGSFRGIVFDLFHTLVDPEDYRPKSFRRAEVLADLLQADRVEFSAYWERTARSRYSCSKPVTEYLKEFQGNAATPISNSVLNQAEDAIGRYQDLAILNPRKNVVSALRQLKAEGFKIGLLSNAEEREVRKWPLSPLAPFFDCATFSFETGRLKPDLLAYQVALSRLQLEASSCAYVGDGGSQELVGARDAGFLKVIFMRGFVSTNGLQADEELGQFAKQSDIIVDDLRELSSRLS